MDQISNFFAAGIFITVIVLLIAVGLAWAIAYSSALYFQNTKLDGSGQIKEAVVVKRTKFIFVGLGLGLSVLFFLMGMLSLQ